MRLVPLSFHFIDEGVEATQSLMAKLRMNPGNLVSAPMLLSIKPHCLNKGDSRAYNLSEYRTMLIQEGLLSTEIIILACS